MGGNLTGRTAADVIDKVLKAEGVVRAPSGSNKAAVSAAMGRYTFGTTYNHFTATRKQEAP